MKDKRVVLAAALAFILVFSLFLGFDVLSTRQSAPDFWFGVEMAYSNATFNDVKTLVDEVKDYTNLFVIGSPEISMNQTLLNMTCDYISNAGLHFIILFTDTTMYNLNNSPRIWIPMAKEKYGDKFLAVYRYDEPGGRTLDHGIHPIIDQSAVGQTANYTFAAGRYVEVLYSLLSYYLYPSPSLLTSDYGLFWFDYQAGYNTVLTEFGSNHSREQAIALCRGAAEAFGRDWGTIITWQNDNYPWIESPSLLYQDLVLSYRNGARYSVVFDYPKNGTYGILTKEHLDAMKNFWSYVQGHPKDYGVEASNVAYVVPSDYGFGFRNALDHVWVWNSDILSAKVYGDVERLLAQYGSRLDIVYDDAETFAGVQNRYSQLFFWNETIP